MGLQTRGTTSELDKAERRLAALMSIDPEMDLGYGLTVAAYGELIATIRATLTKHNQLVADLHASRKQLDDLDAQLATVSGQFLSALKIKHGKDSVEYSKVIGASGSKKNTSSQPNSPSDDGSSPSKPTDSDHSQQ